MFQDLRFALRQLTTSPGFYQLYQPMAQEPLARSEIAVHAAGVAPSTLVASIRTTIALIACYLPARKASRISAVEALRSVA